MGKEETQHDIEDKDPLTLVFEERSTVSKDTDTESGIVEFCFGCTGVL